MGMDLKRPTYVGITQLAVRMNDIDVRFTPNGKQLAVIYTNLYPMIRFETWNPEIIVALTDLIWPAGDGAGRRITDEVCMEVTGTNEIQYLVNMEKETVPQNVFTVRTWRLAAK